MSGDLDAILELGDFPWSAPTAPGDPYFGNVISLLHFNDIDGTTIPHDEIPGVIWTNTIVSRAVVKNTNPKFGSGSLSRPHDPGGQIAGGLYTTIAGHQLTQTTLFTAELWVYFTAFTDSLVGSGYSAYSRFCAFGGSNSYYILGVNPFGKFYTPYGPSLTGTTTAVTSTWYHIAVTCDGSTIRLFVNGNLESSVASTTNIGDTNGLQLSPGRAYPVNGDYWDGYIDDWRFTYGVCRYTSNFTPPTSQFPDSQYLPATPGGGIVFPTSGSTLSAIGSTSGVIISSEVNLLFNPDGTVYWTAPHNVYPNLPADVNGLTRAFNWIYPNQIDTGDVTAPGASYWIRCVPVLGGIVGPTAWTPLTSQVRFVYSNPTPVPITKQFSIQIASDAGGSNIVCNSTGWKFSSFTLG